MRIGFRHLSILYRWRNQSTVMCLLNRTGSKWLGLAVAAVLLALCMLANMLFGYHRFQLTQLWDALFRFDGSREHLLIRTVRAPAALIGAAVGASLAVAGAVMQAWTRNSLASPSVLGVNAGAVLMIAAVLTVIGGDFGMDALVWFAFAGAGIAALLVMALGAAGAGGFQPLKVALAGAAVSAFASAVTSGLMLLDNRSMNETLLWLVGSVSGRSLDHLLTVLPYLAAGLALAMLLARSLNVLAMDDETAKGLGQWTALARLAAGLAVMLLAGGSVALAGPIAFVGLMVPHLCRYLVGTNHVWLIPYSAFAGAILLVSADLASRFLLMPKEVPVGVTTALIGVPFLIHLARRRRYE